MPDTLMAPDIGRGLAVESEHPVAVSIDGATKSFKLPRNRYSTLKERILQPRAAKEFDWLHAVHGVSVEITQGEFFGIVGRNGSGKSTLLKCLAGIYQLDAGSIKLRGNLSPFIELGVGFNMEMTARDNVMINAIMLGLSRREASVRFDQVIEFADLHDFLDLKLKNYSSGMLVRLAFAVSIQVRADILLIDEVLAVGDANFQQKCFDELERMKREGTTVMFVTHDMSAVERFCTRAMLMNQGKVIEIGDPNTVARHYNQLNFGSSIQDAASGQPSVGSSDSGDSLARRGARILDVWCENAAGERADQQEHGEQACIAMAVEFSDALDDPIFAATLRNGTDVNVFSASSATERVATGSFRPGDRAVVRIRFANWLAPDRYTVDASVARHGTGADIFDQRDAAAALLVHSVTGTSGAVRLPHTFEVVRG